MKNSVALIALATCLFAGPAGAYPHLTKSTPADRSTVSVAPSFLELTFSVPARVTSLTIQKDHEAPEAVKALPTDTKPSVRISLPPLAPGVYTIIWHMVGSEDSRETVSGLQFTVAAAASPSAGQK
jgi:methionine-rich copper-binding protein CopC